MKNDQDSTPNDHGGTNEKDVARPRNEIPRQPTEEEFDAMALDRMVDESGWDGLRQQ